MGPYARKFQCQAAVIYRWLMKRVKKEGKAGVQKRLIRGLRPEGLAKKNGDRYACCPRYIYRELWLRLTKLPPSTCAAGSIPGKIPDAPVSAEKAQWSPCRIV